MKSIQIITIYLIALFFTACYGDDVSTYPETPIDGRYTPVSVTSNNQIDLNGDGIFTTNLLHELSDEYSTHEYNLVLKTNKINGTRFLNIFVPHPNYYNTPVGSITYTSNSLNGSGYNYSYDQTNRKIFYTGGIQNAEDTWGKLIEITHLENNNLYIKYQKKYFYNNQWENIIIEAEYTLIP